ncbi:hypothetical protein [Sphingomonas hankookensis]|uniref:hypothetical protein n=1 Tax=Sphingomonas hankookensis TaxID=563996 RepID=UPI00234ED131|nr:hypothetical protein [Sphingomonas hankookensis]WCP71555.1 hypothetical protein PPZ50_14520 [Sphingomonas hankookensis]
MMIEDAIAQRVLAATPIVALIGDAFTWGARLPALPALQASIVADTRPERFGGPVLLRETIVQFDAWADDAAVGRALREAVIAALTPAAVVGEIAFRRGFVVAIRASGLLTREERAIDPELSRQSIDIKFWHLVQ